MPSSVRFARPCWSCRHRNTIGSSIESRSPQAVGGSELPETTQGGIWKEGGPVPGVPEPSGTESAQRQFFDYAGPLRTVVISPAASTLTVNQSRRFRALPRDRSHRRVEQDLLFSWEIGEGSGLLSSASDQEVSFQRRHFNGLVRLAPSPSRRAMCCTAQALITVTDSLDAAVISSLLNARGLPARLHV